MLNGEIKQQAAPLPRRSKSKQPLRSYLKLNAVSFFVVGLLMAFVTFQVGSNVAQRIETPQTASSAATASQNNGLIVPPMDNNSTNSGDDDSNNFGDDNNNGFANNNGFGNANSNNNSGGGLFGSGIQINPPSFGMPQSGHS